MNNRCIRFLQFAVAFMDFLLINCGFIFANYFKEYPLEFIPHAVSADSGLLFSFLWILLALPTGVYSRNAILHINVLYKRSLIGFVSFTLLLVLYGFFYQAGSSATINMLVAMLSMLASISLIRFLYLIGFRYFRHKDFLMDKVVLIGYNNTSKKIASYLEENEINKEVIGFCDEASNIHELSHYPILSGISNAFDVCKKYGATEIYSTIAPEYNPEIYRLIQLADQHCIHFRFFPDISALINRQCYIDFWNDMPVLSLRKEPLQKLDNRVLKTIFDFIFSLCVAIFLLSWLVPLVGLLIWLDSKGPIFFIQTRNGKDNRKFSCIKFRSMKVNTQADLKQATKNDQRLTRVGKFLRHTNIDELPQFLNVLRGEMSVVGPRPHMLKHTLEYSEKVNDFMIRHFVKPGITGWAQVNGCRGEIRTIEKLRNRVHYDIWYLENWSFLLDLKIILLTIVSIIKGDENAY